MKRTRAEGSISVSCTVTVERMHKSACITWGVILKGIAVVANFLCYLPNNRRSLVLDDPKLPKKHQHQMRILPPTIKYKQGAKGGNHK